MVEFFVTSHILKKYFSRLRNKNDAPNIVAFNECHIDFLI